MSGNTTVYHTAHIWERGRRRSNEDSLVIMDVVAGRDRILLAAVADGIGGLEKGGYAGSYVTGQIKEAFTDYVRARNKVNLGGLCRQLMRTLYNCHLYLRDYGNTHAIHLGTTVSILCLIGRRGIAINVGDSRLYLIGHHVKQLGRDHIDSKGHLNRCIGSGTYHRIQIIKFRLNNFSKAILCTDGFYRLGAERLCAFADINRARINIGEDKLHTMLTDIGNYVISHGESDNISAIAISTGGIHD